ncbi:MAG: hypothetical protein ACOCRO_02190 [Halanaerobiales bacterium]
MPTDKTYNKSWRDRMLEEKPPFNPEFELIKETQPSPTDTVIKHPDTGAYISINDNGSISLFSENNVGIKIDPTSRSIQLFGYRTKIRTNRVYFHTDNENGLVWNHMPFNRELADPFREIMTASRVPFTNISGTKALENILTNVGTYITSMGPTNPGLAKGINTPAVGLKGIPAYTGTKESNMVRELKDSMKDIQDNFNDLN